MSAAAIGPSSPVLACERTPIHLAGAIQPHGALLAAEPVGRRVVAVSANVEEFLGRAPDALLGLSLDEVFLDPPSPVAPGEGDGPREPVLPVPCRLKDAAREVVVLAHLHAGRAILEVLPDETAAETRESLRLRQRAVADFGRPSSLAELCDVIALTFRLVTGYDRVMVYRFHDDLHGEVVAERTDRPDRLLGLHYPAGDIPEPARRLYRLNPLRVIADAEAAPASILSAGGRPAPPLDLTHAKLRGVAPVHVEYLRAMGVRASMSTALMVDGRLWGLVACHHAAPRYLAGLQVHTVELLGQLASAFVERVLHTERLTRVITAQRVATAVERDASRPGVVDLLRAHASALNGVFAFDLLAAEIGGERLVLGGRPDEVPDLDALGRRIEDGVALVDRLHDAGGPTSPDAPAPIAGGALLHLTADGADRVFLGRRGSTRVVDWAGDPDGKTVGVDADGGVRVGPRASFALRREVVTGLAPPFLPADPEALHILRRTLVTLRAGERERAALAAKREAERKEASLRLDLLHSARLSSMGELASGLAHELNQPLTAVINFVAACREELASGHAAAPVLDLMDEAVEQAERAGEIVRRLRRFIERGDVERTALDVSATVAEAVRLALPAGAVHGIEIEWRLAADPPVVFADKVQVEQVVFNLVRNAAEAMDGLARKPLRVTTARLGDGTAEVRIADGGPGLPPPLIAELFRPFTTSKADGMGLGLSLCRSIVEAHGGRIVARDRASGGAEFVFTLPSVVVG